MSDTNLRHGVKEIAALSVTIPRLVDALKGMKEHGLSERALIVLAADASGIGKRQVEKVFKSFKRLEKIYLVKKDKS